MFAGRKKEQRGRYLLARGVFECLSNGVSAGVVYIGMFIANKFQTSADVGSKRYTEVIIINNTISEVATDTKALSSA